MVGAVQLAGEDADLVFITSDAQLLRFRAAAVRPQGRAAGGMAGIRLSARAAVVWFGAVPDGRRAGGAMAGRSGGGDRGREQRRAARHRRRHRQGDPVPGVPGQGTGHRRGPLPPFPQGRGHAWCWPGPGRARPAAPPRRACRCTCRPRTAAGTAPGSGPASRLAALGGGWPALAAVAPAGYGRAQAGCAGPPGRRPRRTARSAGHGGPRRAGRRTATSGRAARPVRRDRTRRPEAPGRSSAARSVSWGVNVATNAAASSSAAAHRAARTGSPSARASRQAA